MICSRCRKDIPLNGFAEGQKTCKKCRKYQKEYYKQNRDQAISRALKSYNQQYQDDPDLVRKKKREGIRKSPVSYMLWQIKARAQKRGIPFDLSHDDIKIPERCPILGVILGISDAHSSENSPSVDRIDPSRGYVRGNIQIISHKANSIKNNATAEELQKVAAYMKKIRLLLVHVNQPAPENLIQLGQQICTKYEWVFDSVQAFAMSSSSPATVRFELRAELGNEWDEDWIKVFRIVTDFEQSINIKIYSDNLSIWVTSEIPEHGWKELPTKFQEALDGHFIKSEVNCYWENDRWVLYFCNENWEQKITTGDHDASSI